MGVVTVNAIICAPRPNFVRNCYKYLTFSNNLGCQGHRFVGVVLMNCLIALTGPIVTLSYEIVTKCNNKACSPKKAFKNQHVYVIKTLVFIPFLLSYSLSPCVFMPSTRRPTFPIDQNASVLTKAKNKAMS